MKRYIYKKGNYNINIIHLGKTWEKLMVAARVIAAIENPQDIVVCSQRPFGSRAVMKFAHYTGAQSIAQRWTPGTLTNQITGKFMEPRLLIVTDPKTDSQAVKEASYANIPCIALCDTDSPLEVLYLRGTLQRGAAWDVMVDSFFWRDPEELERQEKEAEEAQEETAAAGGNWGDMSAEDQGGWE